MLKALKNTYQGIGITYIKFHLSSKKTFLSKTYIYCTGDVLNIYRECKAC